MQLFMLYFHQRTKVEKWCGKAHMLYKLFSLSILYIVL